MVATESWRVRLSGADGRIHGGGVLIDSQHVLTCAHVVAGALGTAPGAGPPGGRVLADFPAVGGVMRMAEVDPEGWIPAAADGRGDLAVLVLDGPMPDTIVPAPLGRSVVGGQGVRAYGYPPDSRDGVWAWLELGSHGGPAAEWVQLDAAAVAGRRVERGFSGAGALDSASGKVVGLVVAADRSPTAKAAWMVPMEVISRYLPTVHPLLTAGYEREPPARTVAERVLTSDDRRHLYQALLAVPGMRDRARRDLYLRAVQQQLGSALPVLGQPNDELDVWALLDACLARPGGVRSLVEVLATFLARDPAILRLEDAVERLLPDLLLEHRERAELERLLADAPPAQVAAAYRRATAGAGLVRATVEEWSDPLSVIRHLETFGRLRGGPPPPLLVFVADLAPRLSRAVEADLRRWIDAVGRRLSVDLTALRQLYAAAEPSDAAACYLIVMLQPDGVDEDRYLMSAWWQEGHWPERTLLRDDLPRTVPEIAEALGDLLPDLRDRAGADLDEFIVEFVLPRRLITHPVHQWVFDRRFFPRQIGLQYPVVVRSLERLRSREAHIEWRRKWRWLADHGHRDDPAAVEWVDRPRGTDPQVLYGRLALDQQSVCLAMAFPPGDSGPPGGDVFAAALAAGMPVILWSNEPVDPVRFRLLVRELMGEEGALGLPRRMLWQRRSATTVTVSEGQLPDVGLLWDDAERIPPPFRQPIRLRAPQ